VLDSTLARIGSCVHVLVSIVQTRFRVRGETLHRGYASPASVKSASIFSHSSQLSPCV
jgi:hypothetical protein